MTTFRHGQPLRSDDLQREFGAAHGGAQRALAETARLADRLDQLELALLTVDADRAPADRPQGPGTPATLYLPATPGVGCTVVGAAVATERVRSRPALMAGDPTGFGELSLLRPGEVFAALAETPVATFEARLDPAYLTEYNELVLPHVAGDVTWRLHHSRGYHEYPNVTHTTTHRWATPREFNGLVEIVSESRRRHEGLYVHAAAGPEVTRAEWISTGTLQAARPLPFSGEVRVDRVGLAPGNAPAGTYRLFLGPDEVGDSFTAAAGDVLRVEVEVSGLATASHVAVDLYHA